MDNRRITFITGANRGLGFALAEEALSRGDFVLGTSRDEARTGELFELGRRYEGMLRVLPLDVSDEASCTEIGAQAARIVDRVDLLVNNAGINSTSRDIEDRATAFELSRLRAATLDRMMRTNSFGPLFVTRSLLPLLSRSRSSARVLNMSSRRGSLDEKTGGQNYGYCMSKAALNMATRTLAADLSPQGIIVVAVHPGAVRTSMAQTDATLSPNEAAARLFDLADRLTLAESGFFLESNGARRSW